MNTHRFDPVDLEQMRLRGRLSPGRRVQAMLDARELAVGFIRGRLRRRYPNLSSRELNLKVLQELARAQRMMVFNYVGADQTLSAAFDEPYVDAQARTLGQDVDELWGAIKAAARREADQDRG